MRVLYIDDNFSDADIVRRTLARTTPEIDLTTVASLAECLACLEKSVHYDVLLTDLDLPDGSGLEVLRYIREWRLPLAVVIMTGPGEHDRGGQPSRRVLTVIWSGKGIIWSGCRGHCTVHWYVSA